MPKLLTRLQLVVTPSLTAFAPFAVRRIRAAGLWDLPAYLLTVVDGGICDMYIGSELQEFMYLSNDVVWPFLWHTIQNETGPVAFDKDSVMAAIRHFDSLDEVSKFNFMLMEYNSGYYYAARDAFFDEIMTADAAAVAKQMFLAENEYVLYCYGGTDEYKDRLESALETLEAAYKLLDAEDLASFECLNQIYTSLMNKCKAILG